MVSAILHNKLSRKTNILNCKFEYNRIHLSIRETQVLAGVILGMTTKQIGKLLFLSPRTVEYYLKNIRNKFDGLCRYQIITKVLLHGFPLYKFLKVFSNFGQVINNKVKH